VKAGIKSGLEGLKGVVPGLVEIVVRTEGLASYNADVMLDSTLESEGAFKGDAVHPAHVARPLATASRLTLRARATRRLTARANVANGKVRSFTQTRLWQDPHTGDQL